MTVDTSDILRSRYELGGREPGRIIDCLGTVLTLAERMGLGGCAPDPWRAIRRAWLRGDLSCHTGFPSCWVRLTDNRWRDGDVLLFYGRHPWAAIVCNGHVWSADEDVGSAYCRAVSKWTKQPAEVWRHDPTVH